MELTEPIEQINQRLIDEFGLETDGRPRFRVVFSEDQFEKRLTSFTDEGLELLFPEVRELPKYRQYIHAKYLMERLVPVLGETDLVTKTSYECAWVFQDKIGNYLPPRFDACKFVAEALFSAISKAGNHTKYKDPNISAEARDAELNNMIDMLFGNETATGDALAYGSGVSLSTPVKQEKVN